MGKQQLELLPDSPASESVVSIPLSGLSLDGKAKKFVVRNDSGETLLSIDASTGTITLTGSIVLAGAVTMASPLASPLLLPSLTTTERGELEAIAGMAIFNSTDDEFQFYDGTAWVSLVAA